jgi:1,2-diacylglycerol 3-beta-galactosyltransferase
MQREHVGRVACDRVRRFLFVISDTGGGHRASARAVQQAMERTYGDAALVELADVLVESRHWLLHRLPRWYALLVKWGSIPWGTVWHLTNHPTFFRMVSRLVWLYVHPSLECFLTRYSADVIVSFHPVPNRALMLTSRQMRLTAPMIVIVTDLVSAHVGWFALGANRYLVPTESVKRCALLSGVPSERVEVIGGIPVRRAFAEAQNLPKAEARAQLGLPKALPMVLIVGGGDGFGPLVSVVRAIAARRPQAHLVVVAGRNQVICEQLRSLDIPTRIRVLGFVTNMEIWMRAADLLVTKAGPSTLSEAFVCGVPVILYSALRGQEAGNVGYVAQHRVGVWAPRPEQTADEVMSLLGDPTRRHAMAARGRALGHPDGAEQLARRLWDVGQNGLDLSEVK